MKILIAALLGAVAMFAWEFVAHTFTPLGDAGIDYLPNESTLSPALASSIGQEHGLYFFPTGGLTKESSSQEKQQAMERIMEEIKTKPSGLLLYKPPGTPFNLGKNLAVQFVTDFVKALLVVLLLAQARLATFAGRFGFVAVAGVLAAIATNIPFWNWWGFPGVFVSSCVLMEIIGFCCAGLVIAWLLKPGSASA